MTKLCTNAHKSLLYNWIKTPANVYDQNRIKLVLRFYQKVLCKCSVTFGSKRRREFHVATHMSPKYKL